jgi:hypothetical protein
MKMKSAVTNMATLRNFEIISECRERERERESVYLKNNELQLLFIIILIIIEKYMSDWTSRRQERRFWRNICVFLTCLYLVLPQC